MESLSPGIGGRVLPHAVAFLLRQLEGKVVAAVRSSRLLWCGVGRVMLLPSQKLGSDAKNKADSTRLVMHRVVKREAKGTGFLGKDCVHWRTLLRQYSTIKSSDGGKGGLFCNPNDININL